MFSMITFLAKQLQVIGRVRTAARQWHDVVYVKFISTVITDRSSACSTLRRLKIVQVSDVIQGVGSISPALPCPSSSHVKRSLGTCNLQVFVSVFLSCLSAFLAVLVSSGERSSTSIGIDLIPVVALILLSLFVCSMQSRSGTRSGTIHTYPVSFARIDLISIAFSVLVPRSFPGHRVSSHVASFHILGNGLGTLVSRTVSDTMGTAPLTLACPSLEVFSC